jgi:hypothetical protein
LLFIMFILGGESTIKYTFHDQEKCKVAIN